MTATLILAAWLLLPAIALLVGMKLYVPRFLARHRAQPGGHGDELALRRELHAAVGGDRVGARRRSA
jgi:hypothetical protein